MKIAEAISSLKETGKKLRAEERTREGVVYTIILDQDSCLHAWLKGDIESTIQKNVDVEPSEGDDEFFFDAPKSVEL